jgi:hypothetical protein
MQSDQALPVLIAMDERFLILTAKRTAVQH